MQRIRNLQAAGKGRAKGVLTALLAVALLSLAPSAAAQRILSLDSCRALALRNNKKLGVSRANREMAGDARRAARTDYLPKLDAAGAYQLASRELSLLSKGQQDRLNHLGDHLATQLRGDLAQTLPQLTGQGALTASQAQALAGLAEQVAPGTIAALNEEGASLRKALRTNTRNLFGADLLVRQPIFMGGAIKAENEAARIAVEMADNHIDLQTQRTLYDVDQAYWLVVSLRQKQALANEYLSLVRKFHDDVSKMLAQGVATRASELRVAVRVNEAEMQQTQADDGVVLARMRLCQICGLELDADVRVADEDQATLAADPLEAAGDTYGERPELKLLDNAVELSRQHTILTRAAFLPQLVATGGYFFSTPNVLNGYQRSLSGLFHVGVTFRIPVWNWGEGKHRVRAAKAATAMARLELADTREKIGLQVRQAEFRLKEARKTLDMATRNLTSADENLRCANLGFSEGVMQVTDVMEVQTAWQAAQSQKIDAEIGVRMAHVNLRKALGTLR